MKVKVPFEPSLTAQVAGLAALDDEAFLAETLQVNKKGMDFLKQEFDALNIHQVPSEGNFITTVWDSEVSLYANSLDSVGPTASAFL